MQGLGLPPLLAPRDTRASELGAGEANGIDTANKGTVPRGSRETPWWRLTCLAEMLDVLPATGESTDAQSFQARRCATDIRTAVLGTENKRGNAMYTQFGYALATS